jgi:hypothetical protein
MSQHSLLLPVLIIASTACPPSLAFEKESSSCKKDDLAIFYAENYSAAWIDPLTDAFVSIEFNNIRSNSNLSVTSRDLDQLRISYKRIIEKYYAMEAWLPGTRDYVNEHLTLNEQCKLLEFYRTEIGKKALQMQITPGGSEFIRQQATNHRREQERFNVEREETLRMIFPTLPDSYFSAGKPF